MSRRRRDDGGMAARRAVVRWSWRLFRREWRQQVLILILLTVAVALSVAGASAAYNMTPTGDEHIGAASHRLVVDGSDPEALATEVDAITDWFGTAEPIGEWTAAVPGSSEDVAFRAQAPDGPYGHVLLALRDGRYPEAGDEVAVTDHVADDLGVGVGSALALDGRDWTVVGTVENPRDLADQFVLASPATSRPPDSLAVLVSTTDAEVRARPDSGSAAAAYVDERTSTGRGTAAVAVYLVATVVLLLVALVAGAGFVVMAQRRQRQIGLLAATGATDRHVRLVMLANGAAVGAAAAVIGTGAGLLTWLALAPVVEPAAGHRIDRFDVPWWVVVTGMVLAMLTATGASWWPARATARMPVMAALSARPPAPRPARRPALLAGAALAIGAAAIAWSDPNRTTVDPQPVNDMVMVGGVVAITVGILLVCPSVLGAAGRAARRLPLAGRLAVRDLARYHARSGAALGAISLAVGIPVAVVIVAAAAEAGSDAGNLSDRQLLVRTGEAGGPFVEDLNPADLPRMEDAVDRLAGGLGDAEVVALDMAMEPGTRPEAKFDDLQAVAVGYRVGDDTHRDVVTYVATPDLLSYYGLAPGSIDPETDVLTVRREDLVFLTTARRTAPEPVVERARLDVRPYSSAPTTLVTQEALTRRGWETARAGWLIESATPVTAEQVRDARELADIAGLRVESRNDQGQGALRAVAIGAGALVALAVVAMTVGLVRAEAADDLRTLAATGAGSTIRRWLTAWTAGALGLLGVALGGLGAYLALASGYIHDLAALGGVPWAELAILAAGVPLLAAGAGWLLGGREPPSLVRPDG